jgi:Na+-translocating ferredoxin:NAD+ oxidoreductase RnfG subunit
MFWNTLDKIGIILGIFTAVPVVWTFIILFTTERRRKKKLKNLIKNPKAIESVLIIDVSRENIKAQVVNWLKKNPKLKKITEKNIYYVGTTDKLTVDNIDKMLDKIREARIKITDSGSGRIHLFYRGPVTLAAIVGAEFSNGCPVVLYQNSLDKDNTAIEYQEWGSLNRN